MRKKISSSRGANEGDNDFDELLQRDGNEGRGDPIEDDEYDNHGLNDLL